MTYTIAFDNTYPPGNTAANLISGTFRDKTTMVGERLVDIFGMPDFTSNPLKINYVRVGYGTSTFGGQVRYTDDIGDFRWISGIDAAPASKDYEVYDVVNSAKRFIISAVTGIISIPIGLSIGTNPSAAGIINLPNAMAITARNAANTSDYNLIYLSSSNIITFDSFVQMGASLVVTTSVTAASFDGNGAALTAITGANVTGVVPSATVSGSCTGNAATASLASNATALGGASAASYALLSGAAFTGNISVPHANSVSAGSFLVI